MAAYHESVQHLLQPHTEIQEAMTAAKNALLKPDKLRILVCDQDGRLFFSNGLPPRSTCTISCPVYELLAREPLLVEDKIKKPPCCCEYILIKESLPSVKPNAFFNKLHGTFFVYKYVTSQTTGNRVQIEMSTMDQASVIKVIDARYRSS